MPSTPRGLGRDAALFVGPVHEPVRKIVARIQERGLLEADVHEGGLHAGQDAADSPLHYRADDVRVLVSLDVKLVEAGLLQHRDAGFPALCVDDDLVLHSEPIARAQARGGLWGRRWRAVSGSGRVERSPVRATLAGCLAAGSHGDVQFRGMDGDSL